MKGQTPIFYLFVNEAAAESGGNVFYRVDGEARAKVICSLFTKTYSDAKGLPAFHAESADGISTEDQILIEEALGWLEVYDEPDPGLYDPQPPQEMLVRAQYAVRAKKWEESLGRTGLPLDEDSQAEEARPAQSHLEGVTWTEQRMKQRSQFFGNTNYTAVPLTDIIAHLQDWKDSTERCCTFLRGQQKVLEKLQRETPQVHYDQKFAADMVKWERKTKKKAELPLDLSEPKPFLWKYTDVEGFIDGFVAEFERYAVEFTRLIEELPHGVRPCHAEALRQITDRRDRQMECCRTFRTDYVVFSPCWKFAEAVHREVRTRLEDYMDLTNVAFRLDALARDGNTRAVEPDEHPALTRKAAEVQPDMMSIPQAALYARVTTRTVGNWLKTKIGNDPMLKDVFKKGRLTRIPRTSLEPFRHPERALQERPAMPAKRKTQSRPRRVKIKE